jgi:pseudouridine-5'-phosphate glycosidase
VCVSREAESLGIKGKDVTPFLLKRVNERSQGESLRANIALVKNNAHKGAQLALAYARLKQQAGEEVGGKKGR